MSGAAYDLAPEGAVAKTGAVGYHPDGRRVAKLHAPERIEDVADRNAHEVVPAMERLRGAVDAMEEITFFVTFSRKYRSTSLAKASALGCRDRLFRQQPITFAGMGTFSAGSSISALCRDRILSTRLLKFC